MKKLLKFILCVGLICACIFGVVSCTSCMQNADFSNWFEGFDFGYIGSGNGGSSINNIDYDKYHKEYDNTNPEGQSGIYKEYIDENNPQNSKNVFGLSQEIYSSGKINDFFPEWYGGNNGKLYLCNVFDIVTPIYTEEELNSSLNDAKNKIASENMSVNYQYLFDNKTYTNSNVNYELSLETAVGEASYANFEKTMFEEFDKAIARNENFLIYASNRELMNSQYGKVFAYGYIEGLGYIFISVSKFGTITISVENKYFTRIDTNDNVLTWYSNEDAIKIPVARTESTISKNFKGIFWDYSPNMIRATASGLFGGGNNFSGYTHYAFTEGNYLGITGKNEAIHLYGAKAESKYDKDIKDDLFFNPENYMGGYFTDFNNFFYGNDTYALFGDLADANLKKIVNVMFSVNMKPCNDFEEECNWFDEFVDREDALGDKYYSDNSFTGSMLNLKRMTSYLDLGLIQEIKYSYPTADKLRFSNYKHSDGYYYYFDNGNVWFYGKNPDGSVDRSELDDLREWYLSLEVKPYIRSYENIDGKVTIRNWSLCLGEEVNISSFNKEGKTQEIGLTTKDYDFEEYWEYRNEKYGEIVIGDYHKITDETNTFRTRFN